jgi:hypothetical protein
VVYSQHPSNEGDVTVTEKVFKKGRSQAVLVTINLQHFMRVRNLMVEDGS